MSDPGRAVSVRAVTVHPGFVEVDLLVAAGRRRTDAEVARRTAEALPGLARHRCLNDDARTFAEELADTETAHLFEHVALELMALAGSPRSLQGTTVWDFARDGVGSYRISLEYDDDLVCLGAIKAAVPFVSYALGDACRPDIAAEAGRLASLRGHGRA